MAWRSAVPVTLHSHIHSGQDRRPDPAEEDGLGDTMQLAWRSRPDSGHALGDFDIALLAGTFDWRDQPAPVRSILKPASPAEASLIIAQCPRKTAAELDASPQAVSDISRKFGLVTSEYMKPILDMNFGQRPWYQAVPEYLLESLKNVDTDFGTVALVILCINTMSEITRTGVPPRYRDDFSERRRFGAMTLGGPDFDLPR